MKTKIINYPDLVAARDRHPSETTFEHASFTHFDEMKEIAKDKKYFIHTLGCQANIRDEETMRGMLESVGYSKCVDVTKANIVILNTCAIREMHMIKYLVF